MSAIDDKVALAITAQEAGDYTTALTYLRSARMLLMATPDVQATEGFSTRWDRNDIDRMIRELKSSEAGAKGIQKIKPSWYSRRGGRGEDCHE